MFFAPFARKKRTKSQKITAAILAAILYDVTGPKQRDKQEYLNQIVALRTQWTSDLKAGGSTPSPCNRVVSLDKKLYPTLSLSTRVCKMGTSELHT